MSAARKNPKVTSPRGHPKKLEEPGAQGSPQEAPIGPDRQATEGFGKSPPGSQAHTHPAEQPWTKD